jgi:drug/metabolite transporter (DMT)-like permease
MPAPPLAGEILSLCAGLAWAAAVVLYRRSRVDEDAVGFNVVKSVIAAGLFAATLLVTGTPFVPDRPLSHWLLLAASGLLGIALADTLLFLALARTGAGLIAIVDTAYSPAVILLSAVLLAERMGTIALFGAALVVVALIVGSTGRPTAGHTRRDVVIGILLGTVAVVCMAVAIVIAKPVLDTSPVLWATAVRVGAGTLGLLPLALVRGWRAEIVRSLRLGDRWRLAFPGIVLGAYGSMILWVAGMKFTLASVASVLNQLSTIFIAVFAYLFLKEPMGRRRLLALALAMAGAVIVILR